MGKMRQNSFTLVKTDYFHTNDVCSCNGYDTSGARLDASYAWLDTNSLCLATNNNSGQLHYELDET